MTIRELLQFTSDAGASDLHISTGSVPMVRVLGKMKKLNLPKSTEKEVEDLIYSTMNESQKTIFKKKLEIDFSTKLDDDTRFRVNAFHQVNGMGVAFRVIPNVIKDFDELHLPEILARLAMRHRGLILVTGPTGSGKSTTLATMVDYINDHKHCHILTIEDPVEYRVDGITQSQINHNIGYTFENGLRAILRQDPDVVMVGEIRDIETAEIAAQAALTGHIVLSTLHTNNAVGAIERLINMGLEPFMVAPSVTSVIAQRLSRRLCTKCRKLQPLSNHEKKIMNELSKSYQEVTGELHEVPEELYSPVGCPECSHTGYHGQIGVYEVFHVNPEVEQAILDGASHHDLFLLARKYGMLTLREDGFLKVLQGITSISELMRVTADRE